MTTRDQLDAYASKINLALFADIAAFVMDTAKAGAAQRNVLRRRCPFWPGQPGGAFQEKYGFLYLGELLERYEERFGMSVPDLRAIALALGYTRELLAVERFVGSQRDDFVRKVRKSADGDIYLSGALHLLGEDPEDMPETYEATEDLIFAMSLSSDPERALARFKPELMRLLGKERTMPVQGNTDILAWLIAWMFSHIKAMRGKDMALPRALCALPVSHVKPESRHHAVLLEHGWTPFEIAYANMAAVMAQPVPEALGHASLVTEKIAVTLFREALSQDVPLNAKTYELLSGLYQEYKRFHIKCYGCENLDDTLSDVRIRDARTFAWFAGLTDITHRAFDAFDILDGKWDALAADLRQDKYLALFELNLAADMDAEDIRRRIGRYDTLTGRDYLALYREKYVGTKFALMVDKGLIDLWQSFNESLDDTGEVKYAGIVDNIYTYLRGIGTEQAYRFYEKFFAQHGIEGLKRFWNYDHTRFLDSLTERYSYGYGYQQSSNMKLKLDRSYLDDNGRRQLLSWLEDYVFTYSPEQYPSLVIGILRSESVAGLFTHDDQRAMFQAILGNPKAPQTVIGELKHRYLTQAEQQAEKDAAEAARKEAERRGEADLLRSVTDSYEASVNGTFASVHEFLDKYRYHWRERPFACRIVQEHLDEILSNMNYELDGKDAVRFLRICATLADNDAMSYSEAQNIISKVKERAGNDKDD